MAVNVYDRWHKTQPRDDEPKCREHKGLVPSKAHGKGDRWQVRWDVYQDGERHQPKRNFRLKVGNDPEIHADAFVLKLQAELSAVSAVSAPPALTLSRVYEEWSSLRVATDSTDYTVTGLLTKHICQHDLGQQLVADLELDPNLIQHWIKDRKEIAELKPRTIRQIAGYIGTLLEYARLRKYITSNPMRPLNPLITLPRVDTAEVIPYTLEELQRLRETFPSKFRVVIESGAGIGLRIGEIMGLSPGDIIDDVLHVRRQLRYNKKAHAHVFALPKGGKTRKIPLADNVRDYLESLPARSVSLPWETSDGDVRTVPIYLAWAHKPEPYVYRTLLKAWEGAHKQAGIPRVPNEGFHRLRHTFASLVLAEGATIRDLQEYLGHANPEITLGTYCHLLPHAGDKVRSAMTRLVP